MLGRTEAELKKSIAYKIACTSCDRKNISYRKSIFTKSSLVHFRQDNQHDLWMTRKLFWYQARHKQCYKKYLKQIVLDTSHLNKRRVSLFYITLSFLFMYAYLIKYYLLILIRHVLTSR